jgi:hypothetical protein
VNKLLSILWLIFFIQTPAQAQDAAEFSESDLQSIPSKQAKKFSIRFDDELIKGAAENPEAEYLFNRGEFNFKRLIRLRENFIPEVRKGKDDMRGAQ